MQYQLVHDSLVLILLATITQLNKMFKRKIEDIFLSINCNTCYGCLKEGSN